MTQQWIQNTWRKSSTLSAKQCSCVLGALILGKVWMDGNLPRKSNGNTAGPVTLHSSASKMSLMTQDLYKQSCLFSPLGVLDIKANRVPKLYFG